MVRRRAWVYDVRPEHALAFSVDAQEVGQWNEMLAGLAGEFKDLFGGNAGSAIAKFPNFEHMEARGRNK